MKEQFGISNIELKLFESYLSDREKVSSVIAQCQQQKGLFVVSFKDLYWAPYCSYPRADGAKRRARVLIPPWLLTPGETKSKVNQ